MDGVEVTGLGAQVEVGGRRWEVGGKVSRGKRRGTTHESWPAVCLVTAAAMPPVALAFFLSFFEPETMVTTAFGYKGTTLCAQRRRTYWAFKQRWEAAGEQ